jgi:hypothetical protein
VSLEALEKAADDADAGSRANGAAPEDNVKDEDPRPLHRAIPDAEPFPVEALGDVLGPAVNAIQDIVQAPPALCAQALLGAASLAAQGEADVRLPHGSVSPLSNYLLAIAESGERKSAADNRASGPIMTHERELAEGHGAALRSYKAHLASYKAAWKAVAEDNKLSAEQRTNRLEELGDEPEAPPHPIVVCAEPTYEGLFRMLREGPRSVGIFSTEGGQFVGGYAMSEDHRLRTAAALSDGWDGKPWKRVRGGDGIVVLHRRRVTLNLMVQPLVAQQILESPILRDQGLLSRILIVAPPPASGTRHWHEPSPESFRVLARYSERIREILGRQAALGTDNELRALELEPRARGLWIAYFNSVEKQLGWENSLAPIKGLANKAPEHAARLAGILTIVQDVEAKTISHPALAAGITLMNHYLGEAIRLRAAADMGEDIRRAARLLRWLQEDWTEEFVSPVEIYQLGPREFRDKRSAEAMIQSLWEHGWLVPLKGVHEIRGIRRRQVWRMVKRG